MSSLGLMPLFLHNTSLMQLDSSGAGIVSAVPQGGRVGTLNMASTRLPPLAAGYGLLVLLLDPLARMADTNRTDNIFVQFVNITNNLTSAGGMKPSTCAVAPIDSGIISLLLLDFLQYCL